ncbi:MAG: DEAD/DEAH box helicase family protein [Pedobacter sp.]|nr:DEAD/DEAH box helicase family protein [Pedobacter sp.]MDQ8052753.1 DEAD/DEAH box helicase family protein [Pedobacter sp.]
MELKTYQKQVINDLHQYFSYLQEYKRVDKAFNVFWEDKAGPYSPLTGEGMRSYQNTVPSAIHLSIKVPTAGGKTFIACNALKTIFDSLPDEQSKAVVWLVPWSNLLDQTVKNLSDPNHPYCQKLNALFNNRVQVYEKAELLQGASFNPSVVKEQLSIMVMNFSSIRAKNKDDRKINEQNSNLANFSSEINDMDVLEGTEKEALINVIRSLNPVLIVDESHNAESDLSVEMLKNLNPSFILDLTATPKQNSNLISLVSAMELKKEHMVKLPVIVYNHQNIEGVVESAIHLQHRLEREAKILEAQGGKYIRPIVLFQAQPKTKEDNKTFDKLKAQLIEVGIPEEQIKIKTANKDELRAIDLLSKDCPVRYIITINALKEGWDCPFAYILASLADRSSAIDVTQILGRVLRQPYTMKHDNTMLNLSYVITSSIKFQETLQNIIDGLKLSGFSEKDYRDKDVMPENIKIAAKQEALSKYLLSNEPPDLSEKIFNTDKISININHSTGETNHTLDLIESMAIEQNERFQKDIENQHSRSNAEQLFSEIGMKVKQYKMRDSISEVAKSLVLPKFVMELPPNPFLLMDEGSMEKLDRANLLRDFKLSDKDTIISFDSSSSELYKVDAEEIGKGEYKMSPYKIDKAYQADLVDYFLAKPKEGQIKDLAVFIAKRLDKIAQIPEIEIKKYALRILENMSPQELINFNQRKFEFSDLIKQKINDLADVHAEATFDRWSATGKIKLHFDWKFDETIIPGRIGKDIGNSLYAHEGEMNGFEEKFISEVANLPNILFWHRNLGRGKGFALNGFKSNHYPDFILVSKSGKIILIENKGADRDNSDSISKLRLGKAWENMAGMSYKYFMVFEKNAIPGALNFNEAVSWIKDM